MKNLPTPFAARPHRGFTLIEVLIVLAVLGILASLAYPSYVEHVRKARRSEAKAALLDLAMRQERYFTVTNTYADAPAKLGYPGAAFPIDVQAGAASYYRLNASLGAVAGTFLATATPVGPQAADACGTFSINQFGVLGNTGNSAPAANCW